MIDPTEPTEQPGDVRKLAANTNQIRELIYKLARTGEVFSMDDVTDKLGGIRSEKVHANLLSAARLGLIERVGKTKSRRALKPEEWVAGTEGKRRDVITYRGAAKFRKEGKKDVS